MIKTLTHSLLLFCILCSACSVHENKTPGNFVLFPQPKHVEILGVSSLSYFDLVNYFAVEATKIPVRGTLLSGIKPVEEEAKSQITFSVDSDVELKAEGYTLDITDDKVVIVGKDEAGLLYAFMTLEQLMEDSKEQGVALPLCKIKDYPSLQYRAIQLDIKHHLEKAEYYYQLMDKLASYKINAIIAEVEDKLAYKRQPKVGAEDALSMDEWKKLSAYAKERNIEISPLVQGLGHASFVLKHDEYKELRDDPESDWAFNPLDPKTYDVQFDLYLDAMEAMPYGRYLHVGGDEVHTTGRESGKSALELQLIWLSKVSKFAEEHNRIPIFWDDMPLKQAGVYRPMFDPEMSKEKVDSIWDENEHKLLAFLDNFPKNCIYMRWNYRTPETYGNSRAMEWFREHGMQVMGATAAQTRWVLMPQNESNMGSIKHFALESIDKGINGLLCTLWDDDSPHFELYMRGVFAFAEYTWAGDSREISEVKSAFRHREFSSLLSGSGNAFIDNLEGPVAFWKNALLDGNKRNYLKKNENSLEEFVISFPDAKSKGEWSEKYADKLAQAEIYLKSCDSISEKLETMKEVAIRNTYRLEVYESVNNLAKFSPQTLLALKAYDQAKSDKEERDALDNIKALSNQFTKIRSKLETVYGKTRILTKPDGYILDQDHHSHLANQSTSFDWQFLAEMLFMEKLDNELELLLPKGDF